VNAQIRAQVHAIFSGAELPCGDLVRRGLLCPNDQAPSSPRSTRRGTLVQAEAHQANGTPMLNRLTSHANSKFHHHQNSTTPCMQLAAKAAVTTSARRGQSKPRLNLEFTRILSPLEAWPVIASTDFGDLVGPCQWRASDGRSRLYPIGLLYASHRNGSQINFTKLFTILLSHRAHHRQLELHSFRGWLPLTPHRRPGCFAGIAHNHSTNGALRWEPFPNPDHALIRPGTAPGCG